MTSLNRIAFVKLSPLGKSYAMRCEREGFTVGDHVEVEMYAGTERSYFDDGVITSISFQRWNCSCHVVNHCDEVSYSVDTTNGFQLIRRVDIKSRSNKSVEQWRQEKAPYFDGLPTSARDDMRAIYEAVAPEDGEDAYLGDGVWIRPDGSLDDSGR